MAEEKKPPEEENVEKSPEVDNVGEEKEPKDIEKEPKDIEKDTEKDTEKRAAEENIFEAVVATETPVEQFRSGEAVKEVLLCDASSVDLTRFASGNAPILYEHERKQVGVILGARIENKQLIIRYKISVSEPELLAKIKEKIVKNVSVGYRVLESDRVGDIVTAKKWEPYEVSIVTIPADPNTGTRGFEMCNAANIPLNDALQLVTRSANFVDLAEKIRDFKSREESKMPKNVRSIEVKKTENEYKREAITESIENRVLRKADTDKTRSFVGYSLLELSREYLKNSGVSVDGLNRNELATRALTSASDLPNILADVANKSLQKAYEIAPATYQPFVNEYGVADFKAVHSVKLSDLGALEEVKDGDEITHSAISDSGESIQLKTYGRIITFTRKALINDDLQALSSIPARFGQQVQALKNKLFWSIVTANANMSDGYALFSSNHANLAGSGAGISIATLSAARAAMRKQKGLAAAADEDGLRLNITPKYLVVPAVLETDADQIVTPINPVVTGEVNPFSAKLTVVAEPILDDNSATAWYLFGDKNQVPLFDMIYLNGAESPQIETFQGEDILGVKMRIVYDCAVQVVDYRGLYKNPGA